MIMTLIEISLSLLVLLGIAYEDKLCAFEDRIADRAAQAVAKADCKTEGKK